MKKLLFILLFVNMNLHSQNTIKPTNWVTDNGNFYTDDQEMILNKMIYDYEKLTSIEIAVITVDSLGEYSVEEYADKLFNEIGIGKKGADNGLLILFSMKDRKSRIEVGNGLEEFFTDSDAYDALQVSKPYFKAGNYADGTVACIQLVTKTLGNEAYANKVLWLKEKKQREAQQSASRWENFKNGSIIFIILGTLIGFIFYGIHVHKRKEREVILEQEKIKQEAVEAENIKTQIVTNEKYLKSIKIENPKYENSKILKAAYDELNLFIKNIVMQQGELTDKQYNEYLISLGNVVHSKTKAYTDLNAEYFRKFNSFKTINSLFNLVTLYNADALKVIPLIESYNYPIEYKDLKSDIDGLEESKNGIIDLLATDVDKALEKATFMKTKLESFMEKSSEVINYYKGIKKAEEKTKNHETLFNEAMANIRGNYKAYLKTGDIEPISNDYEIFKSKQENSLDYIMLWSLFSTLLASIAALEAKLKTRKFNEERERQEENRRSVRNYSSSSSSLSSSSSDDYGSNSSFGSSFGSSSSQELP